MKQRNVEYIEKVDFKIEKDPSLAIQINQKPMKFHHDFIKTNIITGNKIILKKIDEVFNPFQKNKNDASEKSPEIANNVR